MLHDLDFADGMTPHFFRPVMTDGVIDVPRPAWLPPAPPRADVTLGDDDADERAADHEAAVDGAADDGGER